ncbi:MAG: CPBP family intramembrane metalloprotease [Bdellovibrionaceae bacterium]|nr:CPBP family intramembrane metalloprotease [Pseudobdellovibrionaceae bacterium]
MATNPKQQYYICLLLPLTWGILSYVIFSLLRPLISISQFGSAPLWMWLWLLQMILFTPFWVWLFKQNFPLEQRNAIRIFGKKIPFGKPLHYLFIAYIAAAAAIPFHNTWYAEWLVFGGIVSPIFEELFSRNLLTPWLKKSWVSFLSASAVSSTAFALMHWGFNNAEAFVFSPQQQFLKFLSHFIFAMVLCLIFRLSKSVQLLIWLHIVSNLQFILTKL